MAKKRPNVIPIIEDARHPQKYRMLVPMVDVVFADVAQPDQVRHTHFIRVFSALVSMQMRLLLFVAHAASKDPQLHCNASFSRAFT